MIHRVDEALSPLRHDPPERELLESCKCRPDGGRRPRAPCARLLGSNSGPVWFLCRGWCARRDGAAAARPDDPVLFDSTLLNVHSDKEDAAATYVRVGLGVQPIGKR
jgi:hypothetical protein